MPVQSRARIDPSHLYRFKLNLKHLQQLIGMSNYCLVTQGQFGSENVSKKVSSILYNNPLLNSVHIVGSSDLDVLRSLYHQVPSCKTLSRIVSDAVTKTSTSQHVHILATPSTQVSHDKALGVTDSFTFKNNHVRLILTPNTYHQCPSLARLDKAVIKKLDHTKKGHGAKHYASFNYSVALQLSTVVPVELTYILDNAFGECDLRLVTYNLKEPLVPSPMPSRSVVKTNPLNPRLEIRPLLQTMPLKDPYYLQEFYEYLTLLHMNSSLLIPDYIDSYLSSYEVPEIKELTSNAENIPTDIPTDITTSLSVHNIHSQSLSTLDKYVSISIRTSNSHYLIYKCPVDSRVTIWECT
jgi:hypothetical protein